MVDGEGERTRERERKQERGRGREGGRGNEREQRTRCAGGDRTRRQRLQTKTSWRQVWRRRRRGEERGEGREHPGPVCPEREGGGRIEASVVTGLGAGAGFEHYFDGVDGVEREGRREKGEGNGR